MTSNKIKSINWPLFIELGVISHPDVAHHGRLLLGKKVSEFEHLKQFEHQ